MTSRTVVANANGWNVEIACFPEDDRQFASEVQQRAQRIRWNEHSREDAAAELVSGLACSYPAVMVRPRHDLALLGRVRSGLYAFRDGAVIARGEVIDDANRPGLSEVRPRSRADAVTRRRDGHPSEAT